MKLSGTIQPKYAGEQEESGNCVHYADISYLSGFCDKSPTHINPVHLFSFYNRQRPVQIITDPNEVLTELTFHGRCRDTQTSVVTLKAT